MHISATSNPLEASVNEEVERVSVGAQNIIRL